MPGAGLQCIKVFEDNIGARSLVSNPVPNSNTKNVDVRYHFIREFIENGDFSVIHLNSEYQHANMLTKPLDKSSFAFHRDFATNMS